LGPDFYGQMLLRHSESIPETKCWLRIDWDRESIQYKRPNSTEGTRVGTFLENFYLLPIIQSRSPVEYIEGLVLRRTEHEPFQFKRKGHFESMMNSKDGVMLESFEKAYKCFDSLPEANGLEHERNAAGDTMYTITLI